MNGKALYHKLYNTASLKEDTMTVYKKYASLMKYKPEIPQGRHILKFPIEE